jgi:hypothetical protein
MGWQVLLLRAILFVLLFASMDPGIGQYDESLILDGALRVLHGQLPYRDFYTLYGPGQFYVLAGVFHVFGVYAALGRVTYMATALASLFAIIRLQWLLDCRPLFGPLAAFAALVWVSAAGTYLYPVYPALALILMAALCLVRHWQLGTKRWIAIAGVLVGVTVLFRHDMAMYSVLAICAGECFYHLGVGGGRSIRSKCLELLLDLGVLAGCILVVAVPAILVLLRHVPFADIRYEMFYYPSHVYPVMRRLPFFHFDAGLSLAKHIRPAAGQIFVLVPMLVPLAATACLVQREWRARQPYWQVSGYVLLLCLALVMPISGLVRPDLEHAVPALLIDSLLLISLVAKWGLSKRFGQAMIAGSAIWFLLSMPVQAWRTARRAIGTVALLVHPGRPGSLESLCRPPAGLERLTCMRADPVEVEEAEYIQQHTRPGEEIYSGAGRHDKLDANDLLLYFLSKRDSGTKWYELTPGVQTTYPIQKQMIQDLDNHHVTYVVRNFTWDAVAEPNESRFSSGVTILDQYIDANYKPEASFPQVLILHRTTPF